MRIKKRNVRLFILLILVAGSIGGYFYYQQTTAVAQEPSAENDVQTATARRGNITISATGAGTVVAATEINLGFQSGGILQTLNVQVGDEVKVGDILATLDKTTAEQSVANAELQLTQALVQIDDNATNSGTSFNAISIEQAQLNLEAAQSVLADLTEWEPDANVISLAEANLASAEASYNAALGQEAASSSNIQIQAINITQAERDLADAQSAYDVAYDSGRDWEFNDPRLGPQLEAERERTAANLLRAQENVTIAQTNYQATISSTNKSSSVGAESNLLNAQISLEEAMSGPSEEKIEAAETAVRQAELALQQAQLNNETDMLGLEQAKLNLAAAQQTLNDTELVATMDGTVMSIAANIGEQVNAGTFITIADLNQPLVELFLDEADFGMVGVGFTVNVTFDALPDEQFVGEIILIDPQLTVEGNVTVIRAIAQLNPDSFAKPQNLPVGLNATVEVIGGQANNALLIPVEALRETSPGQFVVFVMENGTPELTFVEVGIMDFTFSEIISGLEEGDIVTTGLVETE